MSYKREFKLLSSIIFTSNFPNTKENVIQERIQTPFKYYIYLTLPNTKENVIQERIQTPFKYYIYVELPQHKRKCHTRENSNSFQVLYLRRTSPTQKKMSYKREFKLLSSIIFTSNFPNTKENVIQERIQTPFKYYIYVELPQHKRKCHTRENSNSFQVLYLPNTPQHKRKCHTRENSNSFQVLYLPNTPQHKRKCHTRENSNSFQVLYLRRTFPTQKKMPYKREFKLLSSIIFTSNFPNTKENVIQERIQTPFKYYIYLTLPNTKENVIQERIQTPFKYYIYVELPQHKRKCHTRENSNSFQVLYLPNTPQHKRKCHTRENSNSFQVLYLRRTSPTQKKMSYKREFKLLSSIIFTSNFPNTKENVIQERIQTPFKYYIYLTLPNTKENVIQERIQTPFKYYIYVELPQHKRKCHTRENSNSFQVLYLRRTSQHKRKCHTRENSNSFQVLYLRRTSPTQKKMSYKREFKLLSSIIFTSNFPNTKENVIQERIQTPFKYYIYVELPQHKRKCHTRENSNSFQVLYLRRTSPTQKKMSYKREFKLLSSIIFTSNFPNTKENVIQERIQTPFKYYIYVELPQHKRKCHTRENSNSFQVLYLRRTSPTQKKMSYKREFKLLSSIIFTSNFPNTKENVIQERIQTPFKYYIYVELPQHKRTQKKMSYQREFKLLSSIMFTSNFTNYRSVSFSSIWYKITRLILPTSHSSGYSRFIGRSNLARFFLPII